MFSAQWNRLLLLSLVAAASAGAQNTTSNKAAEAASAPVRLANQAARPLIAVIADVGGTELTDLMVPRAILAESGVARVVTVAPTTSAIRLVPSSIVIHADLTMAAFDAANPRGADYVIVPAVVKYKNPVIREWIRKQAAQGATIIAICEGARVVAYAGLFDGKRATTHWHALDELRKQYPKTTWVRNERYVADGQVISTTGVSASMPASIFLIERIAGHAVADSVARRLGIASWGPAHNTDAFHTTTWMYVKGIFDYIMPWRHEEVGVEVVDGFDEVTLAMSVDALSRSIRGKSITWSANGAAVKGRQGLRIAVDRSHASLEASMRQMPLAPSTMPAAFAFDAVIARLTSWYGISAAKLVEVGMEYQLAR